MQVRSRQWVVNYVKPSTLPAIALKPDFGGPQNLITLSSVEDDGLGEELQVVWEIEPGARVIEKHFTDDPARKGPDHPFSMTPATWGDMVARIREVERALGDGVKRVEANERDTVVLQRRCLRTTRRLKAGEVISAADLEPLRPAVAGSVTPSGLKQLVGQRLLVDKAAGDALYWKDVEVAKGA